MLEIPHLGNHPRTLRHHSSDTQSAHAAIGLMDCGLIPDTAKPQPVPALIERALKYWIDRHSARMRLIGFGVGYHAPHEHRSAETTQLAINTQLPQVVRVGNKLEALQKAVPGLGETVLWHLDHDLPGTLEIFTPSYTFAAADWTQWMGNGDEKERYAEIEGMGESTTDYEILTRAEFDRVFPKWAHAPKERIKPKALRAIARRNTLAGRVAKATLFLHEHRGEYKPREEGQRTWPPALVLAWGKKDYLTVRLIDDLGNDFFESGDYEETFMQLDFIPDVNAGAAIKPFLADAEKQIATLRAVDSLVQLLKGA